MAAPALPTLSRIRDKVRKITARTANDLSDDEVNQYINDYYLYDFQFEMKSLRLEGYYSIVLQPNVSTYDVPQVKKVIKTVGWTNGFQTAYHQNPENFFQLWPELINPQVIGTGTGAIASYSGTAQSIPILTDNVFVSDGVESFQDDGAGAMISSITGVSGGTVDYLTGDVSVTFQSVVASGTDVTYGFVPYTSGRPTDVLFYNQQFNFRPVPDQPYQFKIEVEFQPTSLDNDNDQPLFDDWWEVLAYGAARKIFADNGDIEQISTFEPLYQTQKLIAERRNLEQVATQRSQTIYASQYINPWGNIFPFT